MALTPVAVCTQGMAVWYPTQRCLESQREMKPQIVNPEVYRYFMYTILKPVMFNYYYYVKFGCTYYA